MPHVRLGWWFPLVQDLRGNQPARPRGRLFFLGLGTCHRLLFTNRSFFVLLGGGGERFGLVFFETPFHVGLRDANRKIGRFGLSALRCLVNLESEGTITSFLYCSVTHKPPGKQHTQRLFSLKHQAPSKRKPPFRWQLFTFWRSQTNARGWGLRIPKFGGASVVAFLRTQDQAEQDGLERLGGRYISIFRCAIHRIGSYTLGNALGPPKI